ncbi:hypothetical protein DH2020_046160 [Rehmannia glutinosa]|uniref:CID domain-containing protein n=1 Tax=Rehmannia glutinosa TaxID=99300 RepID=A0ABR0UC74_REHGL
MAPSRRKGANKATAAAGRRKWKVGDLVLAKVKGFPAWPATVRGNEEILEKAFQGALVGILCSSYEYLKQAFRIDLALDASKDFNFIAFCNPADVEEFTEEKKVYLLGKRRGKGSDFVCALKEIIECFEKLKKHDQVTSDNLTEETIITNENNSDESLTKSVNDEGPITVKQRSSGATNDLNSLTEAAVAAAADDALHDEEMQLEEAQSNSGFTETRVYSTREAKLMLLNHVTLVHRGSRRIMKSFDGSEGHNVNSPDSVSSDSIEENDSEIMTVDSDALSFNDGSSVDSGCKLVGEEPFNEFNEGETELSDRLDFQTNVTIIKKKRKPNRKRQRSDIVPEAKLDEVISESEVRKTESVSPNHKEKMAERYVKENGDEHLPLVKRARARMGRPSPAVVEEGTLVHEEEKTLEVSESFAVQSSGPLSCNVNAPADGESVPNKEGPGKPQYWETRKNLVDVSWAPSCNADAPAVGESVPNKGGPGDSCLLHASPARKPQYLETRKNFVDGEAALPPSKRLHRALEAMSANVAEDIQRASSSPTVNARTNGRSSSTEYSEPSVGEKDGIGLGSGLMEDHNSGDSQSSASESCVGLNMKVPENDGIAFAMVSDSGKTSCCADSSNTEICQDSFEHAQGADNKRLKLSPLNECLPLSDRPAETDTEHQHDSLGSPSIGGKMSQLDCNPPCLIMPLDGCKVEPSELEEAAKRSDPAMPQMNSDSILVEEIAGVSSNTSKDILMDSSDGGGDETHKKKQLCLSEDNQDNQRPEFVGDARPAPTNSNVVPATSPMKVLTSGLHSNSVSKDHLEDRIVSVTQSSSLTDGLDYVARASPHRPSMNNNFVSDNHSYIEKNSSCSNVQSHLEKAKLTGNIGRATRIAIDCAKSGLATKVVEKLAHNLESESSPHRKVDLFFLVDSITQCSGGMKGDAGIYPSAIQAVLPRLLLAAAPPGGSFYENHRQCLKVLRVWLERKILPESILRHHIRELDALYNPHEVILMERALRLLRGHNVENLDGEMNLIAAVEKRSHILEDVDGELEMEDVARVVKLKLLPPVILIKQIAHKVLDSVSNVPDSKFIRVLRLLSEPRAKQPFSPRVKSRPLDAVHHHVHENKDSEAQLPRQMRYCSNACPLSEQATSNFLVGLLMSSASGWWQGVSSAPSHPAPSNQFCQYYHNVSRMTHAPMSHNGPPREPVGPNNRWNFPPRPMNHRQFNPYRPPSEGPIQWQIELYIERTFGRYRSCLSRMKTSSMNKRNLANPD